MNEEKKKTPFQSRFRRSSDDSFTTEMDYRWEDIKERLDAKHASASPGAPSSSIEFPEGHNRKSKKGISDFAALLFVMIMLVISALTAEWFQLDFTMLYDRGHEAPLNLRTTRMAASGTAEATIRVAERDKVRDTNGEYMVDEVGAPEDEDAL